VGSEMKNEKLKMKNEKGKYRIQMASLINGVTPKLPLTSSFLIQHFSFLIPASAAAGLSQNYNNLSRQ
jgi:hypothetical protein